jgi:hypothetical protein
VSKLKRTPRAVLLLPARNTISLVEVYFVLVTLLLLPEMSTFLAPNEMVPSGDSLYTVSPPLSLGEYATISYPAASFTTTIGRVPLVST